MENFNSFSTNPDLIIDEASKGFLLETSKWAKFLAILGFISIGFMVLGALLFFVSGNLFIPNPSSFPAMGHSIIGVIYLVIAVVYYFPLKYLYSFSTKIKTAITTNNQQELTSSFENLKSYYKFIGIAIVALFGLYIIGIMSAIIFGLSQRF